ncbi:ABC transporter permease [Amycolatopsis acidicola]|uniref:ABC transporter permease n=1 Tax=Amycolatopsis acidicola TaxID=2596893 RepID=A0A5N0VJE2_9PSEU|nr:ABC transporter permease [Amycolatopsis acidicola]KAA9166507.1 ABC transporter permease [Amycolatopsis acidicola]
MNATWAPVRAGVRHGLIELRQLFFDSHHIVVTAISTGIFFAAMVFTRTVAVPGTGFPLGVMMLPGVLGMTLGINGIATMAGSLAVEREDGTLLRARTVPGGVTGYVVGKVVMLSCSTVVTAALTLGVGFAVFPELVTHGAGSWLTLVVVLVLGLAATLPAGIVIGPLLPNSHSFGLVMFPLYAVAATSGVFYPLTRFPEWLQYVGQVFPIYWLGLLARSALLPADLAATEIGGSWRYGAAVAVLAVWAIAGASLAPPLLRRMTRQESGSKLLSRRDKAMQRVG